MNQALLDRMPQGASRLYADASRGVQWGLLLTIAGLYFLAARFGFLMAFTTAQVTAVWPPTGLAAVAYVLYGWRVWPGVFIGAFAINFISHEPLLTALGIAAGNTVGGLFGLALMQRFVRFDTGLQTVHAVFGWVFFVAALGGAVSASNGVTQLAMAGIVPASSMASVWWIWWVGDTMGVLLFGSLLLVWLGPHAEGQGMAPRLTGRQWLELCLAFGLLAILCLAVFGRSGAQSAKYIVFPSMIWLGLRYSQRAVTTAVMLICGFAIWDTIHGMGPFTDESLDDSLVQLELFMAVTATTGLTLGATSAQRRYAEKAVQNAMDELETRVAERTVDLESALREKATLLKEVYHRVKNNLQVIQSLLSLQRRAVTDGAARNAIDDTVQRVAAMALVHEKLYRAANLSALNLPDYTRDLLQQLKAAMGATQRGIQVHENIAALDIGLDHAVPFGLLLTELVSNSLKHAFPDQSQGNIWITLETHPHGATLTVRDDGVGMSLEMGKNKNGAMGLQLAEALATQLGGTLSVQDVSHGTVFIVQMGIL